MVKSGKNLQEIYNSGSQNLIDIEKVVNAEIINHGKNEIEKFKLNRDLYAEQVNDKFSKLKSQLNDIKLGVSNNFERSIDDGVDDITKSLDSMKQQIKFLTSHLKDKLTDFKHDKYNITQKNELTYKNEMGNIQQVKSIEVEQLGFAIINDLRNQSNNSINLLQQELDKKLWESRNLEKNVNSAFLKTYLEKAKTIENHFGSLFQTLTSKLQENFNHIQLESKQYEKDFQSIENDILENINSSESENKIILEQKLEKYIATFKQKLEELYSKSTAEITNNYNNFVDDLKSTYTGLDDEINSSNASSHQAFSDKCKNLNNKIAPNKDAFLTKVNNRLSTAKNIQEELQKEHDLLFENIKNELNMIHKSSEEKLQKLMSSANEKLDNASKEIQQEIYEFQNTYQNELKTIAQETEDEIISLSKKFLDIIIQRKSSALKLIKDQTV